MSGVFEKIPLIDPNHAWGADTSAKAYRYFYCPKCRARHKYGHLRNGIDCYRCFRYFSPYCDSYRLEEDRITNLSEPEQQAAYMAIYGMPLAEYEARQAEKQALKLKREALRLRELRWHRRALRYIIGLFASDPVKPAIQSPSQKRKKKTRKKVKNRG